MPYDSYLNILSDMEIKGKVKDIPANINYKIKIDNTNSRLLEIKTGHIIEAK